ncbi:Rcs stress response system protein RcsF [Budvicia diplopodorum]|uniref:Rcs stress response system protein RcsF n=1 Tax=Budvicia diplopodorum TaxID=1119056 RepID=UPI001359B2E7|nr:Rcs stress response system protein RcsF [Budvicia diplopodorum]
MRILSLCLFALFLGGCAQSGTSDSELESVKLYRTEAELSGTAFKELGQVSGDSCQFSAQDAPPSIPAATLSMQKRAAFQKANAVLLNRCELMTNVPGCYRAAICEGTALNVTF